jgi:hypothetical protein
VTVRFSTPAAFSTEPELDRAIPHGFDAWIDVAGERGAIAVTQWLERRSIEAEFDFPMVFKGIERLLKLTGDPPSGPIALIAKDLAERVRAGDAEMAEIFWMPVLGNGFERGNAAAVFEAAMAISEIAFSYDEPRTPGRIWIDVLNWTRQPGRRVATELVQTAFDQVIAAATMDGAQVYAAKLEFRQVRFHKTHEAAGEESVEGDWDPDSPLFEPWFSVET